jgi:PAS domain S-box-containing protein
VLDSGNKAACDETVNQRIKVLLVEDEPTYAGLIQEILVMAIPSPFEATHVGRLSEALERLANERFDVVLLDLSLPDRQGLATYEHLHTLAPSVPIVVLTGHDDDELALQAVREGAQDYLVKGELDGKILARVIRYAIERKRAAEALRQSEEFFRLISENVSDLIAVLDSEGRRLYSSPSYKHLLGDPAQLLGTDSFSQVHPDDRETVKKIFRETLLSGIGKRAEYRMLLKDGTVRYIESQGSVIRDDTGANPKVVVVSRDVTGRMEAVAALRHALSDLKQSHEQLQATQRQLIEAEKLEAVSTFAAGVAHEVKNPLQTVILGVDYFASHVANEDETAASVLADMSNAVMTADAIIHGLLEFSSASRDVKEEDLNGIIEHALRAVENDLMNCPIRLIKDLAAELPTLRFDGKTMKHVFINLFMHALRAMPAGGQMIVRTFVRQLSEDFRMTGRSSPVFKIGETVVGAVIEEVNGASSEEARENTSTSALIKPIKMESGLGLTVLKRIIELYGGVIDVVQVENGHKYTILFQLQPKE